jgi:tight adherence protein B
MELVLSLLAGIGAFYLYTAFVLDWRGIGIVSSAPRPRARISDRIRRGSRRPAVDGVTSRDLVASSLLAGAAGVIGGFTMFGALVPALLLGGSFGVVPAAAMRRRRKQRLEVAQEAWPRLIDEIRVLTGSLGLSIPQALFEAGSRAPAPLRAAFATAHREWFLTTDFERTLSVLKAQLADPTADAACETLLIAYEVGGTDLDRRLEALAEDRREDVHSRKDARARQAGARFARRFVLIVPLGMAFAGMSVGPGRAAYRTPLGQTLVVVALVLMAGCWVWAGRLMHTPRAERVFSE